MGYSVWCRVAPRGWSWQSMTSIRKSIGSEDFTAVARSTAGSDPICGRGTFLDFYALARHYISARTQLGGYFLNLEKQILKSEVIKGIQYI